ncbi:MAG: aminotransferase class IV [Clostridium sp.]
MRNIIFYEKLVEIDDGFMFGRGVFETLLVKNSPLFYEEHFNRLKNSIDIVGISKITLDEEKEIEKIIANNNIKNRVLKIVVTEKNIVITTRENSYGEDDYKKGFSLKLSSTYRNESSVLNKAKTLNYLENILEKEKAKDEGFDDALFLNSKGFLCETTSSNIFLVKDGYIITPSLECGLLGGIIREFIIKNFNVIEKKITLDELMKSEEVFITNSVMGVIKVNKIDNRIYNNEKHYFIIKDYYDEYIDKNGGAISGR